MIDTLISDIKQADLEHEIHPLIANRWSPRAFSDQAIAAQDLHKILEAARWSASANNEQPWQYVYAHRGSEGFDQLWSSLVPGNQPWTKSAAVLMVSLARKNFKANQKTNPWAIHDVGMANAQLILQAAHLGIYGHFMAGFDQAKLHEILGLGEDVQAVAMLALGYLGTPNQLEEPYKGRELSARTRLSISEFSNEL